MKYLLTFFTLVLLYGCNNTTYTEGNYIFNNKIKLLKTGMEKSAVIDLLGPPTTYAAFDENILYYIYETSERKLKFLDKKIIEAKVIALTFNNSDKLTKINIKTEKDRKSIPLDKTQTKDIIKKTKLIDKKLEDIDSYDITK